MDIHTEKVLEVGFRHSYSTSLLKKHIYLNQRRKTTKPPITLGFVTSKW
ncbi:hypothetical protein IQ247_10245 [Plectonema cf. radiosum LEGE 06105]|uniref:Uncharacterized protein n=1 Tax=Plectonema cf. radiosum LEGE 06105 TaxID=945769 RepID=A0A8J7F7M7_9CYAN|nr:hypothetical protein [Plectonema radiosum]MBE9213049.1 hypothetical protein [Plectonema cf. radiosum LEGE 06105]